METKMCDKCSDKNYCDLCKKKYEDLMTLDKPTYDLLYEHICDILRLDSKTKLIYEKTNASFDIKKYLTSNSILEYLRESDLFKSLIRFHKKTGLINSIKPYQEKSYDNILSEIKDQMSEYYVNSSDYNKQWFLSKINDYIIDDSDSDSVDEDDVNQLICLHKKKEYDIILKCINNIKKSIHENPKEFMKNNFKKRSSSYNKLINDYLYFVNGYLVTEILSLEEKYMGLDSKLFTINKNNAIKTYLNILEYLNNPDTFKCGLCLENFSYSTTIDYCCMKNYCQNCMRLQIIHKKECAICRFPITKYPKKKDIIYSAGSMKVDRPLIKYDFANNTDIFDYRCECCSGCPICHQTMGYCDCKLNNKKVLEYNSKIDLSSHENTMEVNNDKRIYNLVGPILFENGSNIENCGHSCNSPCVPPYFGLSLIKHYHNSIKLSDIFILTVDPNNLDSYASYAEWGMASKLSKILYIIPKYGTKLSNELWWFAMESILSINKLKDDKCIDYHMLILNSINPDIRSKKIYYHMLDQTTKNKDYDTYSNKLLPKDKCWSDMNIHEKNAVISIGYSKEIWLNPELIKENDDPFMKEWCDFTDDQRESLHYLGYTADDFD